MFDFRTICVAAALTMSATVPGAFVLAPGGSIDPLDFEDIGEIVGGDPNWFGTPLGVYSRSARETRDGFIDPDLIEDLYDVSGVIDVAVWRTAVGQKLTFQYGFSSIDVNGFGDENGVQIFEMSGFGDYELELGWNDDPPYFSQLISRSLDGDTVTVDYFEPNLTVSCPCGSLLVRKMAPQFDLSGTGVVDISIDSFGVTPRDLRLLPAPSEIPVPAPIALLASGLGLLGFQRIRKKADASSV